MKNILVNSIAFFVVAAGVAYAFNFAATLPDVKVSYSTDQCVEVINYSDDDKYSCENLPTKFNHIWVE
jgi:hypothetical protein